MATPPDLLARERIKRWVADAGLRQQTFGRRIGKGQVWVSRYLRGQVDADLETLQRMAALFGVSLAELLYEPDVSQHPLLSKLHEALLVTPRHVQAAILEMLAAYRATAGRGATRK